MLEMHWARVGEAAWSQDCNDSLWSESEAGRVAVYMCLLHLAFWRAFWQRADECLAANPCLHLIPRIREECWCAVKGWHEIILPLSLCHCHGNANDPQHETGYYKETTGLFLKMAGMKLSLDRWLRVEYQVIRSLVQGLARPIYNLQPCMPPPSQTEYKRFSLDWRNCNLTGHR